MRDDQSSRDTSRSRIPALDALRGAAILAVFCHHAAPPTPTLGAERFLVGTFHLGWAGVDLFFVLSGFLITGILLDSRESPDYFRRFYSRRLRRIFPLYYLALTLVIVLLPMLGGEVLRQAARVAWSQEWFWTYASNLKIAVTSRWAAPYADHFWTLAVEEQFYIVWPLVVLAAAPRTLARTCVLIAVLALLARFTLVFSGTSALSVSVFTLTRADSLALGALPACLLRLENGRELVTRLIPQAAVLGGGVAVAIALADIAGLVGPWWMGQGAAWATIGYSALAVAFSSAVGAAALGAPTLGAGRIFRFLCLTGTYSYGFYILHAPVLYVLRDLGWQPTGWSDRLAYAATAFAIAYALAALSWHYFESPILKRRAPVPTRAPGLTPVDA